MIRQAISRERITMASHPQRRPAAALPWTSVRWRGVASAGGGDADGAYGDTSFSNT